MNGQSLAGRQRNTTLDFVRGIAIILVVVGHAMQANIVDGVSEPVAFTIIKSMWMPLLFFISGYTLGFSYPREEPGKFLMKKVKRLLIPYVCWMSIHYVIACLLPGDYREFSLINLLREFLASDFWFLRSLFIYYFIIGIVDWILHKRLKDVFQDFAVDVWDAEIVY